MPVRLDPRTTPTRFDYDNAGRALRIDFADGAALAIGFAELRKACPCAVCSGEGGTAGRFATEPDLRPGEDELADISLVGAYGLNAVWADGHSTGIYTFTRLRDLADAHSPAD